MVEIVLQKEHVFKNVDYSLKTLHHKNATILETRGIGSASHGNSVQAQHGLRRTTPQRPQNSSPDTGRVGVQGRPRSYLYQPPGARPQKPHAHNLFSTLPRP